MDRMRRIKNITRYLEDNLGEFEGRISSGLKMTWHLWVRSESKENLKKVEKLSESEVVRLEMLNGYIRFAYEDY